jgi:hypothetical protein
LARRNAFDSSFRTRFYITFFAAYYRIGFEFTRSFFSHDITGFLIVESNIVMAQALKFVMRCFQMLIWNH